MSIVLKLKDQHKYGEARKILLRDGFRSENGYCYIHPESQHLVRLQKGLPDLQVQTENFHCRINYEKETLEPTPKSEVSQTFLDLYSILKPKKMVLDLWGEVNLEDLIVEDLPSSLHNTNLKAPKV